MPSLMFATIVFLKLLLTTGCVSEDSESKRLAYQRVLGSWTDSDELKQPIEDMSLWRFSLTPQGELRLSQYEASIQCRAWTDISDFRIEDGFIKWYEFRARVLDDSSMMQIDYLTSDGQVIPFILRRYDAADDFMVTLEESKAHGYSYQIPEETNDGWNCISAGAAGLDMEKINKLMHAIITGNYGDIHSVIIVKDKNLVVEEYFNHGGKLHSPFLTALYRSRLHHQSSVAKSEISAIFGTAYDRGYIKSLDTPINEFFPEYAELFDSVKQKITLQHVLTMSTGLEWDEFTYPFSDPRNSAYQWKLSKDNIRFYLERPVANEPGQKFNYSGGCMMLLAEIIRRTTGTSVDDFATKYFFEALGISNFKWLGEDTLVTNHSGGIGLRPRDMAKIGLVFVDEGRWQERQVISKEWAIESIRTHIETGNLNVGYGYQWWNRQFEVNEKTVSSFYAIGLGGQFIFGFRDLDLVVVFTGANFDTNWSSNVYKMLEKYILPSVIL